MPEIALQAVVSATSSDPRHRAENLLQPDSGGHWRSAAAGEKQISVVLQLAREQRIHSVHIGNDGAAFVEVLVGAAAGGDFQVLLPMAAFLSPGESRAGTGLQRVRLFGPDALVKAAAERPWDRVRLVCSQPYCQVPPGPPRDPEKTPGTPRDPEKDPRDPPGPRKGPPGPQKAPPGPQNPPEGPQKDPRDPQRAPWDPKRAP
ncbi:DNA repair protein XRCC1-like [Oxyura jamaicensis]|uniref:DNA repair protein XRCC1-like n=1 Tax=Oxyura jamaicensis TaxID=8884 RepID=UPI0015A72531|nr:DNA repair protein XRCC1-like [Oxyura jamaicensis]